MTNKISIIFLLLATVLLFESCVTRRLIKEGQKFEEAGLCQQAADSFYRAVRRDRTNIEAIQGLRRTGEFTLQQKLSRFNRAYNERRNQEAVEAYLDAKKYYEKIKAVNVNLNFPSFYHDYYSEVKDVYLDDLYFEGMNFLQEERFSDAARTFQNILAISPNYRDATEQFNIATYEPVYREGIELMDRGRYRQAYNKFNRIIKNIRSYKDSKDLKDECLEKGTVSIAIAPIKNSSGRRNIEQKMHSIIVTKIQRLDNPFVRVIDHSQMQQLVSDNRRNALVGFTAPTATLFCEITSFSYNAGRLSETERKGWLRKRVSFRNSETGRTEYRNEYSKVRYSEYKMNRSMTLSFSYRLINERSGEILNSGNRTFRASDNIHYADYDGDNDNLVPGYWKYRLVGSSEDVIRDTRNDVAALQNLLKARRSIKTFESLISEINNDAGDFAAVEIDKFVMGS